MSAYDKQRDSAAEERNLAQQIKNKKGTHIYTQSFEDHLFLKM